VAASSAETLTALGAHGPEAFGRLGGHGWPKRLETIVDGIHAIEDGRTRAEALSQVAFLYPLVRRMRADIVAMQNSRFWRLRDTWFALKERLGIGSADTTADRADLLEIAERHAARDERITLLREGEVPAPTGDFVGGLDARDALGSDALFEAALALNRDETIDALYADFDTIDDRGYRSAPFFKPDWSPETLLGRNLFAGFALLRGRLFEDVGGLREGTAGAYWYDAALRLTERTSRVAHIPRILHHRRRDAAAVARAADAELTAARDALLRRGANGDVFPLPDAGIPCRLVRYAPRGTPRVTIVVPTRDKPDLLDQCLLSIFERSTYGNFDVLVVDNGSGERATHDVFRRWLQREPTRIRIERDPSPFNFAALNNRAVRMTDSEYVVFLNNDTVVVTAEWIEAMLGYAQLPHIGAVGALLTYPDDTVQHAGVVLSILGLAGHAHRHVRADSPGYYGALQTVTNYSAVTGACMMVERARFLDAGGFDEAFAVAWNDVDFCLRLVGKGYRNVYVPHARLYHFESKTRGGDDTPSKVARAMSELFAMRERWPAYTQRDPHYSPWLTADAEDFGIRV
ncbi:MAG: glycosyltransferase family 2 protein, partial [Candidatus Velthaea sp.]